MPQYKINLPVVYSQNDTRWKYDRLGTSNTTIGQCGCLITSQAMLCRYFGINETPKTYDDKLAKIGGYYLGNLYIWGSIERLHDSINEKITRTPSGLSGGQLNEIKQSLDKGFPVIVCIDFSPATVRLDTHYVVIIDYSGDNFTIADSWDGKIKPLSTYFSSVNPNASKLIRQYVVYEGEAIVEAKPKYKATWIRQGHFTDEKGSGWFFDIRNDGTETWKAGIEGLFFRKDKSIVNPTEVFGQRGQSVSIFPKDLWVNEDCPCLSQRDVVSGDFWTAKVYISPLRQKVNPGPYRDDFGMGNTKGTWIEGFNGWYEEKVF